MRQSDPISSSEPELRPPGSMKGHGSRWWQLSQSHLNCGGRSWCRMKERETGSKATHNELESSFVSVHPYCPDHIGPCDSLDLCDRVCQADDNRARPPIPRVLEKRSNSPSGKNQALPDLIRLLRVR